MLRPHSEDCRRHRDGALGVKRDVCLHQENGWSHRMRTDRKRSLLGVRHVDASHAGLRGLTLQAPARQKPHRPECSNASKTVDVQRCPVQWGFSVAVSSGVDPRHGALAPHPTHGATSSSVAPRRVATRRSHARHSPSVACTQHATSRRVETLKPEQEGGNT